MLDRPSTAGEWAICRCSEFGLGPSDRAPLRYDQVAAKGSHSLTFWIAFECCSLVLQSTWVLSDEAFGTCHHNYDVSSQEWAHIWAALREQVISLIASNKSGAFPCNLSSGGCTILVHLKMSEMCASGTAEKTHVTAVVRSSLQNLMFLAGENLILDNEKKWAFQKLYLVLHRKVITLPVLWKLDWMSHQGHPFHF